MAHPRAVKKITLTVLSLQTMSDDDRHAILLLGLMAPAKETARDE